VEEKERTLFLASNMRVSLLKVMIISWLMPPSITLNYLDLFLNIIYKSMRAYGRELSDCLEQTINSSADLSLK
jgi:hypothetical protein